MDFKALIEFNKYMLALSAASFAYALDKFVPMPTSDGRLMVLALLGIFLVGIVLGVLIFAAATSALHPKKEGKKAYIEKLIAPLGILHTGLLIVGLVVLGGMLIERVTTAPDAPKKAATCCVQIECPPAKS